jgi:hypothetical protein
VSPEEWRPIPGCVGYSISSHARVRSDERVIVRSNGWPMPVMERILRTDPVGRVTFSCEGRQQRFYVTDLVAQAFSVEPAR